MTQPSNDQPFAKNADGAQLVRLSDVEPEEVRWLWRGRIPLGKLTILDGDPGTSKTTLALDLGARVSRGAEMPDGSTSELDGPRGVVLLAAEDGLADTIRPRLDGAGADVDRIVALQLIANPIGTDRLPTVQDVDAVEQAIKAVDAALVVFDPLAAYLGRDVDSHRDASVRSALAGLSQLADDTDVAVLAIRHLNKSGESIAMYRGGGSIAFTASARSVQLVATDPEDSSGTRRVLAPVKCNLAEPPNSMAYQPEVDSDDRLRINWLGPSPHSADDLLRGQPGQGMSKLEQTSRWLQAELSDGPVEANELKKGAQQLGVSERTLRRASKDLGVEKTKDGFDGPWLWSLPDREDVATLGTEDGEDSGRTASSSKASNASDDGQLQTDRKPVNLAESGHLREDPDVAGGVNDSTAEDGQDSEGGAPGVPGSDGKVVHVPLWLVDRD